MVSPMDTVIDYTSSIDFWQENMVLCYPRGMEPTYTGFKSISLDEFEKLVNTKCSVLPKILVDIANGHMEKLYNLSKKFMEQYPYGELMIGNIANPKTYEKFAEIGVKYIRVGIGGGSGCLTSANTGVHYPMASLISECYKIKKYGGYNTKIIADGGFRNYDDIIKALSLGADYVMLGGVLNKTLESCSTTMLFNLIPINQMYSKMIWDEMPFLKKYLYKHFRGMSTKEVQKAWGKNELTTSEGVVRRNEVKYTVEGWVNNFESYLRSAMSYTGKKELHHFIGGVNFNNITLNSFRRFNK